MTQYKFRGQQVGTGKWVYGSLLSCEDSFGPIYHIMVQHKFPFEREHFLVRGETVGMWTGLKDKNGVEIYEGDIYLAERGYMPSRGYKKKGYPDRITVICVVEWSVYDAGWYGREVSPIKDHIEFSKNAPYDYLFTSLHGSSNGTADWVELIGNIHEHRHLLNPSQKGDVLNTMHTDPNLQPASEQQEQATTGDAVQATEQAAQENAMESAEEGGAEG